MQSVKSAGEQGDQALREQREGKKSESVGGENRVIPIKSAGPKHHANDLRA